MFNPTQADVRRFFCGVRTKMLNSAPMEAIETLASLWIAEHPEHSMTSPTWTPPCCATTTPRPA